MTVRFIRIGCEYTPRRGKQVFSADVEINGQGHYFEARVDDVIAALEEICARLRRDFEAEFDN